MNNQTGQTEEQNMDAPQAGAEENEQSSAAENPRADRMAERAAAAMAELTGDEQSGEPASDTAADEVAELSGEDPEQQATEEPAPDPQAELMNQRIVVQMNGREVEMTVGESVRRAGINEATEGDRQQAAEAKREADRLLEEAQRAVPNLDPDAVKAQLDAFLENEEMTPEQFAANLGAAVRVQESLARTEPAAQGPSVDEVVEQKLFERDFGAARASVLADDPSAGEILDINSPLGPMADQISAQLLQTRPELSMTDHLREVTLQTRQQAAKLAGVVLPASAAPARAPNALADRQSAKRSMGKHSAQQVYVPPGHTTQTTAQPSTDPMAGAKAARLSMRAGRPQ